MEQTRLLVVDAGINILLGILLLLLIPFPELSQVLGVPEVEVPFYPSIMGGVFVGVGAALLLEARRNGRTGLVGLGTGGAAAINLCGGVALMGWLVFGGLDLPLRGIFLLWGLVVVLVGLSGVELVKRRRQESLMR